MERGSSPAKLRRIDALTFFSAEEVARARSYHHPLYWAGIADVVIEASVLATLVWSGAGAALDPGSLPWWGRTPAYAAIVVAAAAAVRTPLALWSGDTCAREYQISAFHVLTAGNRHPSLVRSQSYIRDLAQWPGRFFALANRLANQPGRGYSCARKRLP